MSSLTIKVKRLIFEFFIKIVYNHILKEGQLCLKKDLQILKESI